MSEKEAPSWLVKPLEKTEVVGCMCCPTNTVKLDLETVLHTDFSLTVNGERVDLYEGRKGMDLGWNDFPTLAKIEEAASTKPDADWRIELYAGLRGSTHQRQKEGHWLLIAENEGYA